MLKYFRACGDAADLLLRALENERALDVRYRFLNPDSVAGIPLPNYKVMKQIAIRARFGMAYPILLAVAPVMLILITPILWLLAIIGSITSLCRFVPATHTPACRALPTSENAIHLIRSSLATESCAACNIQSLPNNHFQWGCLIGFTSVFHSIFIHLLLWRAILTSKVEVRRDLILHARDSFSLSMMTVYAATSKAIIVTDDHYQRWSYILSHLAQDFRIVQHGFLDTDIDFPHPFGTVHKIYLRDLVFLEQFQRIYTIKSAQKYTAEEKLTEHSFSAKGILLASSFPAINTEIELLKALKEQSRLPVIVKFHPAHTYDDRRAQLSALADMVFKDSGNPACRIFVSYNSFMEYDYKNHGIPTVSIAREGGAAQACAQILEITRSLNVSFESRLPDGELH